MPLRIISFVIAIFFALSCAPKETIKAPIGKIKAPKGIKKVKPVETSSPSSPFKELKQPEPLEQPPPETKKSKIKKIKRKEEPVRIEKDAKEKYVVLNFDGADIGTVISALAEMLKINYILDPRVTGKVTIQSYKRFPVIDLFHIFQTILEVNGLTAVKDGKIYKIVPVEFAKQQPVEVQSGKAVKLQVDSSFITQIVPLEYVIAKDIADIIRNLMPRGADLIVYEPSNILIVTAPPSALVKFMKVLEAIDMPSAELESIKTFVYYVENGESKKLAEILKSLYGEKKTTQRKATPYRRQTKAKAKRSPSNPVTPTVIEGLPGEVEGEIIITAYEDINALIIKATPKNYLTILETLKKLDIPSKQVLIEVLIAEVSLTDSTQYGIEWMLKSTGKDTAVAGFTTSDPPTIAPTIDGVTGEVGNLITTLAPGGAFATIIRPDKYSVILHAFASLGKLNVLSSPNILAMDNKEAKIEVANEIPIPTGFQQQPTTATTTEPTTLVSVGQIQYRTTGIILTVTPHISEKNKVTLKIDQEISSIGPNVELVGTDAPSFSKRRAQTTGVVQSGHTLIIGGLIEEISRDDKSGIPLLSSIPVIGHLFGVTAEQVEKKELLVMVTPHVVSSPEEADALTKEFQDKVKTIKKRLENAQQEE